MIQEKIKKQLTYSFLRVIAARLEEIEGNEKNKEEGVNRGAYRQG